MAVKVRAPGTPARDSWPAAVWPRWIMVTLALLGSGGLLALCLSACGSPAYWPTEEWRTSTPHQQDMDPDLLEQMVTYVDGQGLAVDSILVIRHGYIVLEEYRNGYSQQRKHHIQSATKSFSSTLIGIALQQGLIESVQQRMVDLLAAYTPANMDARKGRITLEHLLTMSDGMDWHELDYPYTDERNSLGQMWVSSDAVQHVLDTPMAREPGQEWSYNSGTSILLGGIIEEVTGGSVLSFAREHLFDPIGIGDVLWTKTTGGHYHTDGGLHMTSRDMARLGYLMLRQGTWDGREIVSPEWVAQASDSHYSLPGGGGYGYQWWTLADVDAYRATGHYEQAILVWPEADVVVVFTGSIPDEDPRRVQGLFFHYIVPACTDLPDERLTERYTSYGLAFDYPLGHHVQEIPVQGAEAVSDEAGLVQFSSRGAPMEFISLMWAASEPPASLEGLLEQWYGFVENPSVQLEPQGAVEQAGKDGEPMVYQRHRLIAGELELAAVTGVWYCTESGRAFFLSYAISPGADSRELLEGFEQYLDSVACHEAD